MQVMVLLLLVAGLALLVLGLMTGSTPLVAASIAASLLAAYVISRVRVQRDGHAGTSKTPASSPEKARVSATTAVLAGAPASASEQPAYVHAPPEPASAVVRPAGIASTELDPTETAPTGNASTELDPTETEPDRAATAPDPAGPVDADDPATPEPAVADTDPPLRSRGDEPVWVIDGRPRYHLPHCGFLLGRQPEAVPLRQAVEDGFTPCALCDPDTGLAAR